MTSYWIEDSNMTIYACVSPRLFSKGNIAIDTKHITTCTGNIRILLQAALQPLCSASLWVLTLPLILLRLESGLELRVPGCLLLFVKKEHNSIIFNLQVHTQTIKVHKLLHYFFMSLLLCKHRITWSEQYNTSSIYLFYL